MVRGNFAVGSDLLQRAMSFFESLGIKTGIAACLGGLATVAQGRGESEAAERWWRRAISLREEGGDCNSYEDQCSLATTLLSTAQRT